MKKKLLIVLTWAVLIFVFLFIAVGYALSDDLYFRKLLIRNHIENADELFDFLEPRFNKPKGRSIRGLTPRYMYEVHTFENGLYCDEGAVMMATMAKILGYKTRLLDFLGSGGISHHTVLEIEVDGAWVAYDTLQGIPHLSEDQYPDYTASLQRRKFPRTYNFFIQYNYFLKQTAVLLRGIPG